MRKLSLKIDDLQVESFSVEEPARERGTVLGHLENDSENGSGTGIDCTVICAGTMVLCTLACYTILISCGGTCEESECGSCPIWECGF
jgi:hypothetical protein